MNIKFYYLLLVRHSRDRLYTVSHFHISFLCLLKLREKMAECHNTENRHITDISTARTFLQRAIYKMSNNPIFKELYYITNYIVIFVKKTVHCQINVYENAERPLHFAMRRNNSRMTFGHPPSDLCRYVFFQAKKRSMLVFCEWFLIKICFIGIAHMLLVGYMPFKLAELQLGPTLF